MVSAQASRYDVKTYLKRCIGTISTTRFRRVLPGLQSPERRYGLLMMMSRFFSVLVFESAVKSLMDIGEYRPSVRFTQYVFKRRHG